jgi:glycosyltransferase involved in cell wall biosynthesis
LGLPREGLVVGSVGRLHPQKAHDTLIEAYSIVRRRVPAVSLVIVGDGAERGALERRARALGVEGGVHFLGIRQDIPQILACLDVFVLASLYEGHPNAVLEALSMELPVVVTDIPPCRDVIVPGETGALVPPGAPVEMAAAIEALLGDEARRRRLGGNGRRAVIERFSLRKMVEEYQQLYAECAQGGRRAAGRRTGV